MTVTVTHTKVLIAPNTGSEDRVYGGDYVDPDSHAIGGLETLATQDDILVLEQQIDDKEDVGTADLAIAAHVAAANPHPGYLTPAEGNAAYQPLDAQLTDIATNLTATAAELNYTDGVTGHIQVQLDDKDELGSAAIAIAAHVALADPHTQYAPEASPTFEGTVTTPSLAVLQASGTELAQRLGGLQASNTVGHFLRLDGGSAGTTVRGYLGYTHTGSGGDTIFTGELADAVALRSNAALHLGSNGDNIRMTFAVDGNVGYGTTTPSIVNGVDLSSQKVFNVTGSGVIARMSITGSTGVGFDLIDSAAGANVKWFNFASGSGFGALRSLTDAGSVGVNYMAFSAATGNIKVGGGLGDSPTARFELPAGTAAANTAPEQLTTGARETTARTGLREYDSNHYVTNWKTKRFPLGGPIIDYFADANNGTTVETDLYNDEIEANVFAIVGDKVCAQFAGIFTGDTTSTQRLRAYFGTIASEVLIFDSGALALGVATPSWNLAITIICENAASVVRCSATLTTNSTVLTSTTTYTRVQSLTLANSQTLKITGTAAGATGGSNQITAKLGSVEYKPAVN